MRLGIRICYKCEYAKYHPWHDDGTINKVHVDAFTGIDWFDEEREDRERIQDGN